MDRELMGQFSAFPSGVGVDPFETSAAFLVTHTLSRSL